MLPVGNMGTVIFYTTFIPMGAMYLYMQEHSVHSLIRLLYLWVWCIYMQECSVHLFIWLLYPWVRCSYMQERSVHSLIWLLYLRVLCIYMQEHSVHSLIRLLYPWVRCVYMQECSVLSDTILYPLQAPIFTMTTEVWPHANRAVVTNNLIVIIEVMLIQDFLYFYYSLS